jgi:hypothetical protein
MNNKVIVAIVRLASVYLAFNAVVLLTYVPTDIVQISHARTLPQTAETALVTLIALVIRILLHFAFAACLWVFARRIAQLLTGESSHD